LRECRRERQSCEQQSDADRDWSFAQPFDHELPPPDNALQPSDRRGRTEGQV
jgi:hypothetical protein